ncbi:hypothetical protein FRC00_010264 [Tulasnella sp. 408]|nr:hypothetical protein FRC00_010264 [Tulasnella sp. 408]
MDGRPEDATILTAVLSWDTLGTPFSWAFGANPIMKYILKVLLAERSFWQKGPFGRKVLLAEMYLWQYQHSRTLSMREERVQCIYSICIGYNGIYNPDGTTAKMGDLSVYGSAKTTDITKKLVVAIRLIASDGALWSL